MEVEYQKKGNMYAIYTKPRKFGDDIPDYEGGHVIGYYSKLRKDLYLIMLPALFRKDPIRFKYSIVNDRKFKSLIKDYEIQIY